MNPSSMTPGQEHGYRQSSNSMQGATLVPQLTRCTGCGKRRTTATGKMLARGFKCNSCLRGAK